MSLRFASDADLKATEAGCSPIRNRHHRDPWCAIAVALLVTSSCSGPAADGSVDTDLAARDGAADRSTPADGAPARDIPLDGISLDSAPDSARVDGVPLDGVPLDGVPLDSLPAADGPPAPDQQVGADASLKWLLVWSDEFNGASLDTLQWSYYLGGENHSQSYYTTANVGVVAGELVIKTQRHCLNSAGETISGSNASSAPCASGQITRYSSGYVRTQNRWPAGRVDVRARMPQLDPGVWPAIWLRNQSGWCTPGYGEIDVAELYAEAPQQTTATTHITCSGDKTLKVQHYRNTAASLDAGYHLFSVEWDTSGVTYFLDGKVVQKNKPYASGQDTDVAQDFAGVTSAQWQTVLGQTWQIRLNTQIVNPGDAWHAAPDDTKPFPPVYYRIDYVRVYKAAVP